MVTLVIYDIPDDRVRERAATACLDAGLARIQYSAFVGALNTNRRRELYLKLRRVLGESPGNIRLYPVGQKELQLMLEIDNPDPNRPWGPREAGRGRATSHP
jgi:CRISPR-associated protein Cas2